MRSARWSGWGVSVTGPSHLRLGEPNQDAWAMRRFRTGVVATISDGLGSCRHADLGARAACGAVMEAASLHFRLGAPSLCSMPMLVQQLWPLMLLGHAPGDCSATCTFVVARQGGGAFLAQLGDGLLAACRADGTVDLLMPDKSDSFANLTVGLASSSDAAPWRTVSVPDDRYCAFVLCTDGVADDLEPDAVRGFAWSIVSHYRRLPGGQRRRDVRRWLQDWPVPGHTDDKTLACVYREGDLHE